MSPRSIRLLFCRSRWNYRSFRRRIFRAKSLRKYLEWVKLDDIPMPTPVCSQVFQKIEEMNPDIAINVWKWKEESAIPKPLIASKNFKRPHVIYLIVLSDTVKSDETGKYGQKNHFLWIKNPDGMIFRDTIHKAKKYLC